MTPASLIAACSSSGSSGGSTSDYSNVTFTTIGYTTVITPGAPMNPFNATNNVFPTFDAMQLGWNAGNSANPNQELPGLAKSWALSSDGTSLTVHLQPGAKWSNGKPVTATDVVDSAVWFAQGSAQTCNLGSVTANSSTTVTFTEAAGASNNLFETVLGEGSAAGTQWIVPSFEYGSLLPPDIWTTIKASEGTGATATAATTTLTNLAKKIDAFAPYNDVRVRQALAYVIDRSAVQKVGEPTSGSASTTITGAVSGALADYLTPPQQASLNRTLRTPPRPPPC